LKQEKCTRKTYKQTGGNVDWIERKIDRKANRQRGRQKHLHANVKGMTESFNILIK
jgi:hypothetical protein